MKAEIGVVILQTKEHQGCQMQGTPGMQMARIKERGREQILPPSLQKEPALLAP